MWPPVPPPAISTRGRVGGEVEEDGTALVNLSGEIEENANAGQHDAQRCAS